MKLKEATVALVVARYLEHLGGLVIKYALNFIID